MAQRLEVPKFATEADEARWWFENRELVADEFELAEAEGRLGHGRVARLAGLAEPALLLEPDDVARARSQAKREGMEYQAYLKMVVHRALLVEEQSA